MSIIKKASAIWQGGLKDGKGQISTESKALNHIPYGFKTRFEDQSGTNPEELIGAALSGCFSMALALALQMKHHIAEKISTQAEVSLDKVGEGFEITTIQLKTTVKVSGISESDFQKIAEETKKTCPVSKVLKAKITLTATLHA